MEKCNLASTPGLQVTEIIGLVEMHGRVTGRLLHVAGHWPEAQHALKELGRGMIPPTNIHCHARLKRAMRCLVDKRTSIWKFDPSASEARASELTATSDSDRGGCAKTRKNRVSR